jgi:hypothetical protein
MPLFIILFTIEKKSENFVESLNATRRSCSRQQCSVGYDKDEIFQYRYQTNYLVA